MKSYRKIIGSIFPLAIIVILLIFGPVTSALADTSGPNNGGAGIDVPLTGTTQVWQNPNNITDPVGSPYATVTLSKSARYSHYLQASNYGFLIPVDATITGIMVVINRQSSAHNPSIVDNVVSLVKAGSVVGDNKNSALVWPTSMGAASYGGTTDLWGTTWTPAEINAPDFGVALSVYRQNSGNNDRFASVDFIQVTVYYTSPTTTTVDCGSGTPVVTYGGTISCEATVAALSEAGTPTGTVNWVSDGLGTFSSPMCSLSGSGGSAKCSVTYTPDAVGTGTHTLSATYEGDGYFTASNGSNGLSIDKAEASCTVLGYSITYDGNPHGATGACTGVKGEQLIGLDLGSLYTNVPGGTADWTFADVTGNYYDTGGSVGITITKLNPDCQINGYSGVYDGNSHGATGVCKDIEGNPLPGLDLGLSFTDFPGGMADWTFTDVSGNYNDDSGSVFIDITKADPACQIAGYSGEYDGDPHGATGSCTGVTSETLAGLLLGDTFTNVPGGTADWAFTDVTGNYNDDGGSASINITKTNPTCSINGFSGAYNGDPHGATGSCIGVKDEPLADLNLGASFTNVPGGNADWTFTDTTGNYNDDSGSVFIDISKANPACTVTGYKVEYDRLTHTATGSCIGVKGELLSSPNLSNTTHTDIGVYATDAWTFTPTTGNYNDANGTVKDEITKRAITVTADAETKVFSQPDPTLGYQVTAGSLLSGDAFTGSLTRDPGESVGTYTIRQGTLLLPDYYQITFVGAQFTITGTRVYLPIILR